jgi:hypothetical protein
LRYMNSLLSETRISNVVKNSISITRDMDKNVKQNGYCVMYRAGTSKAWKEIFVQLQTHFLLCFIWIAQVLPKWVTAPLTKIVLVCAYANGNSYSWAQENFTSCPGLPVHCTSALRTWHLLHVIKYTTGTKITDE